MTSKWELVGGLSTGQIANDIHQSVFEIFSDGRWMDFLPLKQVLVATNKGLGFGSVGPG